MLLAGHYQNISKAIITGGHSSKMNPFNLMKTLDIQADPSEMDRRLRARIQPWELFGVLLCCAMVGIYLWLMSIQMGAPVDFMGYVGVEAQSGLYYSGWIRPVFALLGQLPLSVAYTIFCAINILCAFFTVRVFGGKPLFVLASFQMLSSLYYGNMSAMIAGGISLCWWGLAHKRWYLAGLGIVIATSKLQVGGLWCLLLIWYAAVTWRQFARILVVPAIAGVLSLVLYPMWLLNFLRNLSVFPYVHLGITLWIYVGAWALLLWVPALLLPMGRKERFFALIATFALAIPYYQHSDLLSLAAMPIGWLPLILQVGFLRGMWGFTAIRLTALLPGLIYCGIVLPAGYRWIRGWRKPQPGRISTQRP
jgi:hypothetical protein